MTRPTPSSARLAQVQELPLHRFLGLEVLSWGGGEATVRLQPSPNLLNAAGIVHGGVLYAVLDAVSYTALLSELDEEENAVTHDLHVSVLRPALPDAELELRGRVRQRGRSLVFLDAEAWSGGKLIATARVTKSLVRRASR